MVCKGQNPGFCFPAPEAGANAATDTTSGCAVAPSRSEPSKPVPWRWALAVFAVAAFVRRRRSGSES
jgi:MYXO-CTERM domain-containing protein